MLKHLVMLTALALTAVGVLQSQAGPLGTAKQGIAKKESGNKGQEQPKTHGDNQPATNVPPVGSKPSAPICDEACQQGRENLKIQSRLIWLTGGLVVVGFLQTCGMIWQAILLRQTRGDVHNQARLMEQQAKLMAAQAEIQKATSMQWVDIEPVGIIVAARSKGEPPNRVELTLQWKVVNHTPLPITIETIEIHVLRAKTEEINVVEETAVIPPFRENSVNFHPFFIKTDLNVKDTKEFLEKGILLTIQIEVSYLDACGEGGQRFFGEHYWCERNTLTISDGHLGKTPRKRIEKYDEPSTLSVEQVKTIEWEETADSPQIPPTPN